MDATNGESLHFGAGMVSVLPLDNCPAIPPPPETYSVSDLDSLSTASTIFVGNIPPDVSHSQLLPVISRFGAVLQLVYTPSPGCWACAKVTLRSNAAAEGLIASLNGKRVFEGREFHRLVSCQVPGSSSDVAPADRQPEGSTAKDKDAEKKKTTFSLLRDGPPGANLFIYGIPSTWREMELMELVGPFGHLVGIRVPPAQNGSKYSNRGFGFVSYDSQSAARTAFGELSNMTISGKLLRLQMKNGEEHLLPPELRKVEDFERTTRQVKLSGNSLPAPTENALPVPACAAVTPNRRGGMSNPNPLQAFQSFSCHWERVHMSMPPPHQPISKDRNAAYYQEPNQSWGAWNATFCPPPPTQYECQYPAPPFGAFVEAPHHLPQQHIPTPPPPPSLAWTPHKEPTDPWHNSNFGCPRQDFNAKEHSSAQESKSDATSDSVHCLLSAGAGDWSCVCRNPELNLEGALDCAACKGRVADAKATAGKLGRDKKQCSAPFSGTPTLMHSASDPRLAARQASDARVSVDSHECPSSNDWVSTSCAPWRSESLPNLLADAGTAANSFQEGVYRSFESSRAWHQEDVRSSVSNAAKDMSHQKLPSAEELLEALAKSSMSGFSAIPLQSWKKMNLKTQDPTFPMSTSNMLPGEGNFQASSFRKSLVDKAARTEEISANAMKDSLSAAIVMPCLSSSKDASSHSISKVLEESQNSGFPISATSTDRKMHTATLEEESCCSSKKEEQTCQNLQHNLIDRQSKGTVDKTGSAFVEEIFDRVRVSQSEKSVDETSDRPSLLCNEEKKRGRKQRGNFSTRSHDEGSPRLSGLSSLTPPSDFPLSNPAHTMASSELRPSAKSSFYSGSNLPRGETAQYPISELVGLDLSTTLKLLSEKNNDGLRGVLAPTLQKDQRVDSHFAELDCSRTSSKYSCRDSLSKTPPRAFLSPAASTERITEPSTPKRPSCRDEIDALRSEIEALEKMKLERQRRLVLVVSQAQESHDTLNGTAVTPGLQPGKSDEELDFETTSEKLLSEQRFAELLQDEDETKWHGDRSSCESLKSDHVLPDITATSSSETMQPFFAEPDVQALRSPLLETGPWETSGSCALGPLFGSWSWSEPKPDHSTELGLCSLESGKAAGEIEISY